MQAVLDAQLALGLRPIETLAPADARRQPSAADGVRAVLREQGKPTDPPPGIATTEITYPGPAGALPTRVYKPVGARGRCRSSSIFMAAASSSPTSMSMTQTPRALVRETGAIVVSVEYRRAPEFKFPAQQEDAFAAYQWVLANAASFGGDARKVAVAGESAGGNLAANVAIMARDQKNR
jgi:acetyl esterase